MFNLKIHYNIYEGVNTDDKYRRNVGNNNSTKYSI